MKLDGFLPGPVCVIEQDEEGETRIHIISPVDHHQSDPEKQRAHAEFRNHGKDVNTWVYFNHHTGEESPVYPSSMGAVLHALVFAYVAAESSYLDQ